MNGECCGSREKGQANDIPATLVVVYYNQMDWLKLLISNIACWEGEDFKTESLASPGQFFGLT